MKAKTMHAPIKCPQCGRKVFEARGPTQVLKGRVTVFTADKTVAVCRYCKTEVLVPIRVI